MGKKRTKLSDQIRKVVNDSGLSRYAICKAAGIDQASFSRFMAGRIGLQLSTLDALADVLGLELKQMEQTPAKRARKGR